MARRLSAVPGVIVGGALAGLFDGVVLHRIFQSDPFAVVEPQAFPQVLEALRQQGRRDGVFEVAMIAILAAGIWKLVSEIRRGVLITQQEFWSAVLFGAGAFLCVDGIFNHRLLQLHHVRQGSFQLAWDVALIPVGLALAVGGAELFRRRQTAGLKPMPYQFIRNTLAATHDRLPLAWHSRGKWTSLVHRARAAWRG